MLNFNPVFFKNLVRVFFAGLFIFFVSSCTYLKEGVVDVSLTSSTGIPLKEHSTISIYGLDNNLAVKKTYIEQQVLDSNGEFKINFSGVDKIKIQVKNDSLSPLYLPVVKFLDVPAFWQEQSINIQLVLQELVPPSTPLPSLPTTSEDENLVSPSHPSERIALSQIEDPIPADDNFVYQKPQNKNLLQTKSNALQKDDNFSNVSQDALKRSENNKNIDKTISIKAQFQASPVSRVAVYMGKYASQSVSFLGFTNDLGVLDVSLNPALKPDILFLMKTGFITGVVSVPSVFVSSPILHVDMKEGEKQDVFLTAQVYGVGRAVVQAQLLIDGLKQGASPYFGYFSIPVPGEEDEDTDEGVDINPTDNISLQLQNALPQTISGQAMDDFLLADQNTPSGKSLPPMKPLYVSLQEPFKPSVGLIEPLEQNASIDNLYFRRFRREFFSRFMGEIQFKSMIFSDVLNLAQLAHTSPVELANRGWNTEPFAGVLDFACVLSFKEEGEASFLTTELYDKFGQKYLSLKQDLKKENPEIMAKESFQKLQNSLPVEGYITKKEKDLFFSNLGKIHFIKPNDLFVAYVPHGDFLSPEEPVALLKAQQVEEKTSTLKWEKGDRKALAKENIRISRMSLSEIQKRFPFLF